MINNNWTFGDGAGLSFSSSNPVAFANLTNMNTNEGCASVSDKDGNLIFYTDGMSIWEAGNHTLIYKGLKGNSSSTQSSIIVPDPSKQNRYYILTTDGETQHTGTTYSNNHFDGVRIDVSDPDIQNWAATIEPIGNILPSIPPTKDFSPTERVTAIQHKNCKDFWIITIIQKGPQKSWEGPGFFRVFKINQNGMQHEKDYEMQFLATEYAYLKGSPDGTKIAFTNSRSPEPHQAKTTVEVFDFDNQTGVIDISTRQTFAKPRSKNQQFGGRIYGLEFSPNSNFLYFGNLNSSEGLIYRVDLSIHTSPNLPVVVVTNQEINNTNTYCNIGALQLGPDGKIYCALPEQRFLAAILNPNDSNIVFEREYIQLHPDSTCKMGLPNLLPNPCLDEARCNCGCNDCNEDAEDQNQALIERAQSKHNTVPAVENPNKKPPFQEDCNGRTVVAARTNLTPAFYFHWGDSSRDHIEEHDTEVFYLTVCNRFEDVRYEGLRITSLTLVPDVEDLDRIHIVPDRFISLDCLEPCSCQTREFALIISGNDTAGVYTLEVEYCYEGLALTNSAGGGTATFPVEIIED